MGDFEASISSLVLTDSEISGGPRFLPSFTSSFWSFSSDFSASALDLFLGLLRSRGASASSSSSTSSTSSLLPFRCADEDLFESSSSTSSSILERLFGLDEVLASASVDFIEAAATSSSSSASTEEAAAAATGELVLEDSSLTDFLERSKTISSSASSAANLFKDEEEEAEEPLSSAEGIVGEAGE